MQQTTTASANHRFIVTVAVGVCMWNMPDGSLLYRKYK